MTEIILSLVALTTLPVVWMWARWFGKREAREWQEAMRRTSPYQYEAELEVERA